MAIRRTRAQIKIDEEIARVKKRQVGRTCHIISRGDDIYGLIIGCAGLFDDSPVLDILCVRPEYGSLEDGSLLVLRYCEGYEREPSPYNHRLRFRTYLKRDTEHKRILKSLASVLKQTVPKLTDLYTI